MNKVKDENFIQISGRMINELNLKWNDLLIYAMIYGFSQGWNKFTWSLQYLADRTNSTKRNVINILNKLCKNWLLIKIEKKINGVKLCEYVATREFKEADEQTQEIKIQNPIKATNEINLKNDLCEYSFVDEFIDRGNVSIAYQLKNNPNYLLKQYSEIDKLNKDWYDNATIQVVLQFIKQDEFRSKNILSIRKLREKDKNGVPYIVRMIEKIKDYKPTVVDFDALHK